MCQLQKKSAEIERFEIKLNRDDNKYTVLSDDFILFIWVRTYFFSADL